MCAGRSTKSLQCFKKTHASSPVLHALLACVFLIVLDIDVTWSMSLDKLALERNEVFESQPDSSVSDIGSAPVLVDDMLLQPIPEQENTDLFVLLPANHEDGIEKNTIDVGAEHGSDMLMMETDVEPALEIVAAVPTVAITHEEIKQVENEKQSAVQEHGQLNVVQTPEKVAFEVADIPSSLLLAEHKNKEPVMEQTLNESDDDAEVKGEQNKMAEISELNENQQNQDAIKLDAAEKPLVVNIPMDAVEDLGNALEAEIAENDESVPVIGSPKLELENAEDNNNSLETEHVEKVVQLTNEPLKIPVKQQQEIVLEDELKNNMENIVDKEPVLFIEKATMQDVLDAVEDVLDSQQAAESDSEKELENRPQVEVEVQSTDKEEQKENLPEADELEKVEEAAEETLNQQVQKEETAIQVGQTKDEKPKEEVAKEEEPKEEVLKEGEPNIEELKEKEPNEEQKEEELQGEEPKKEESLDEEKQRPAQEEKLELEQNKEEAKDEQPAQNKPIEIELKGELPKNEEVINEQEKVEEQQLEEFNEADNMTIDETQVLEEEKNGEKEQIPVEDSPVEQNNEEKTSGEEMQANENSQEEQVHEQQNLEDQLHEEQNQQEENLEKQNIEEQNQDQTKKEEGETVMEEQKEEQIIIEKLQEEQHNIEEQKPDEIIEDETIPTIEVVAPTNNDMEALNIAEEAQNTQVQNENLLPEPEALEQQHTINETPLEQEEHEVDKNEDKTSLEIPEEIVVEEQLMPVDMLAAGAADEMTVNNEEEEQQQETEETAADMQQGTEVPDAVPEVVQEITVQKNPDETIHIDEDKTQIAHEEEKEKEIQNPETNSMLSTIVQVPVQQLQLELQPPVQDELQLDLLPPVQDEVKLEEKDDQPIQTLVDSNAILVPAIQIPQAEQAPAVVAQEQQQQQPIQAVIEPATYKPLNVMDSVLNYVNASFTANNINTQNQQQQQQQDNDGAYSAQLRRYDGAQVWRIVVQNDKDKKLADELQTKYDGQLWKEVKQEVDYLLKPQVLADAARHIRAANLSRIVLIDNLQNVIEVENPPADEIAHLQNRKGHRLTWQAYHRLEDIHGFFDYLAKTYPDICSVETIGYSVEKRPLKILKISNGNANNSGIWMDGGMHAREWISPASVTYVANQLVEGWDDLPANMRNINWYIHAVANPDGYEYTHSTDRLWRKNMRSHGRQCPGVDLNRNFGYKWGGKGTSANPCSQTYRGSKAFSEPETFYISKFISNYPRETFQAYLSFHSYGQYILYPWGYDYHVVKDSADLDRVARQAGTTITKSSGVKYTVGSSATTLYPAAGGSDDWAKGIAGIKYSYTIEMGDTGRYGFILPASMIESNAQDAYTFVQTVASAVTNPEKWTRKRAIPII